MNTQYKAVSDRPHFESFKVVIFCEVGLYASSGQTNLCV